MRLTYVVHCTRTIGSSCVGTAWLQRGICSWLLCVQPDKPRHYTSSHGANGKRSTLGVYPTELLVYRLCMNKYTSLAVLLLEPLSLLW
jgi:hypothetical protein